MFGKRAFPGLPIFLIIISLAGAGADSPGGLNWQVRPVVIRAERFPRLLGCPRERLALVVGSGNAIHPIPFQVDPRDQDGRLVLGSPYQPLAASTPAGALHARDEIVFMAADGGEHGRPPPEMSRAYEIKIIDPATQTFAFVYLGTWNRKPPRARQDYVAYRRSAAAEKIVTPHYVQGFVPGASFFSDLEILPAAGGNGRDLFDRLKMRSRGVTVGGITLSFNETDFRSELSGVRDGPVRVIRRTETSLVVLLGLRTPAVTVDALFYRDSFEVPSTIKFPFRADLVLSSLEYYQGLDLALAAGPFTYYCDLEPRGVAVDGRMSPAELALARTSQDHRWGLVAGPAGAILYSAQVDRSLPARLSLFYLDDSAVADPPEREPGVHMYGFRIVNPLAMADQAYRFNIVSYVAPGFSGDAQAAAATLLAPLSVEIAAD